MSKQAVAEFIQHMHDDPTLRREVEDAQVTAVLDVAARRGHVFTTAEYAEVLTAFDGAAGELDEAALADVAGGFNPQPEPPAWWDLARPNLPMPHGWTTGP